MDKLMTPKEASEYLNTNEKTLANGRWSGIGVIPKFIKIGKSVRYRLSDLEEYIQDNTYINSKAKYVKEE